MPDTPDLLTALRDIGIGTPAVGDAGDERVRSAIGREIGRRRRARRRVRLPFGIGSITLTPAVLLVTVATTAAATTVALVHTDPTTLFKSNPQGNGSPGWHQTVIPSTVRKLATVEVPRFGPVQYWVANTKQHGRCWGLRGPNGSWLAMTMDNLTAGSVPGCGPTREQQVLAQGNSSAGGLLPMSVDYEANSVTDRTGRSWDIYYGTANADGAVAVRDRSTGATARVIAGQYFILLEHRKGNCDGCAGLRAIDAAGHVLPANYGPEQDRYH